MPAATAMRVAFTAFGSSPLGSTGSVSVTASGWPALRASRCTSANAAKRRVSTPVSISCSGSRSMSTALSPYRWRTVRICRAKELTVRQFWARSRPPWPPKETIGRPPAARSAATRASSVGLVMATAPLPQDAAQAVWLVARTKPSVKWLATPRRAAPARS